MGPNADLIGRFARGERDVAVKASGAVNLGYQRDDADILDYELWRIGDQQARGPRPDAERPYFAVLGAAQIFGRFVEQPFSRIVAEELGLSCLNLGMSGAGPEFFLKRSDLLDLANRAEFVVVQLMSGRSVSNSHFLTGNNQGVLRKRGDPLAVPLFAENAYRDALQQLSLPELAALRAENRAAYAQQMTQLLGAIKRPKLFLYWSKRPVDYRDGLTDIASYWGDFPHFVNREVTDVLRELADQYVEVVGDRGIPQALFSRTAGEPVLMWPEDDFPNVRFRHHNNYYPSPEMNEDVARAVLPACRDLAAMALARPRISPVVADRNILVHINLFRTGGAFVDRSLEEGCGPAWRRLTPADFEGLPPQDVLQKLLAGNPSLKALSSVHVRLPLQNGGGLRFFPVIVLRNPLLRAHAVYQHERSEGQDSVHSIKAKEMDFAQWVEWCLSTTSLSGPIANFQTRICSRTCNGLDPADWNQPVGLRNYVDAAELLKGASVAVYEQLSSGLAGIEADLAPHFPGISLSGSSDAIEGTGQSDEVRYLLGEALYERLCAANAYDIMLHRSFSRPAGLTG